MDHWNFTFPRNVYAYCVHNSKEQTFYLLSHKGYTSTSELQLPSLSALRENAEEDTHHGGKGRNGSLGQKQRAVGWPKHQSAT